MAEKERAMDGVFRVTPCEGVREPRAFSLFPTTALTPTSLVSLCVCLSLHQPSALLTVFISAFDQRL